MLNVKKKINKMAIFNNRTEAENDNTAVAGDLFTENGIVKVIIGRTINNKLATRNAKDTSVTSVDDLARLTALENAPNEGATEEQLARIATIENNQLNSVEGNVTLIRKPINLMVPINTLPFEVTSLPASEYNNGEIVKIEYKNGNVFYKSNGNTWSESDRIEKDLTELTPTLAGINNKQKYVYQWIENRLYYAVAVEDNLNLTMPLYHLSARNHWTLKHAGERLDWHQAIAHMYPDWQSVFVPNTTANGGKGDKLKFYLRQGSTVAQRRINPTDTTVAEEDKFWVYEG